MAKKTITVSGSKNVNQSTTWINPSDEEVFMKFFDVNGYRNGNSPDAKVEPAQFSEFLIKPNEEVTIPSKYDNAVQRIRDGVIVAGQGPRLQKKGQPKIPMHKSIDPDYATKAAQLFYAKHILEDFKSAQDAVTIATAELVKDQEKQMKSKKESK